MLKLNRIAEPQAKDTAEYLRETLGEILERPSHKNYHENAGQLSFEVALFDYALEAPDAQVVSGLEQAADHLSRALALRKEDEEESRNPYQALTRFGLIACFGDDDAQRRLATLRPLQYSSPPRPANRLITDTLAILGPFIAEETHDEARLAGIVAACEAANASKSDRQLTLPLVCGLAAVVAGDEEKWNLAIAQLVAAHAREARSGELKLLPLGFVCVPALMLAELGLEEGLECRASSEYLPLELLEMEASE